MIKFRKHTAFFWICTGTVIVLAAVMAVRIALNAFITVSDASGSACGYEYVDLGLSVKWSRCNLGASTPEECGNYYAWGEISEKEEYTWDNYKFWTSGSVWGRNIKFSKNILNPEDDVANLITGGGWRMPTSDEVNELIENCTFVRRKINGVYGMICTSRKNGNSIFLPAAGSREQIGEYGIGRYGNYWSSSIDADYPYCAHTICFANFATLGSYGRCAGFPIRPVFE